MFRLGLLLIIVAGIAMVATNPGADDHKSLVYAQMPREMGVDGLLGEVAGEMLDDLDVMPLEYNNYYVFSTMTFRDDIVSVGMVTKVWSKQ